jgi:Flp pilus assembly protein TadD/uncharacterized membrane protein
VASNEQKSTRLLFAIAAFLSLVGVADAFYLTLAHLAKSNVWCANAASCSEVLGSVYAAPGGVSLASLGTVAYGASYSLAILAAFGYRHARTMLALLVAAMLTVTLVLLAIQSFVIRSFCSHCLLSAFVTFVLTACVALERGVVRRMVVVALGALVLPAICGCNRSEPKALIPQADPPSPIFSSPFRNTRPEVRYVGDDTCAQCHPDQAETYQRHPMGRSFAPVSQAAPLERYVAAAHNPFDKLGFQFLVENRGGQVLHKEIRRDAQGRVITELDAEVQFAMGSGTRGRSYLIERDGFLFQSPISWYSQKGVWDLTPSFQVVEHFERPVQADCLFCHCNRAEPIEHSLNRYRSPLFRGYAIGCERCHGPGELHVKRRELGDDIAGVDDTIVNPGRMEPSLRDSVCQQCHLQGESRIVRRGRQPFDYRPGLPLHQFLSVFLRLPEFTDQLKAGSHAVQMAASRCFQGSSGKLGCISCHDPHASPAPETKVPFYRSRCLNCHKPESCGLSLADRRLKNANDNCIDCHMPRAGSSNIAHTAITDHRIIRRADKGSRSGTAPRPLKPGEIPLVHFHRDLVSSEDNELSPDLGLALAELARNYPTLERHACLIALPLLEAAVHSCADDVAAWEGQGYVLWRLDRKEEALHAFEAALTKAPERETTLTYAAVLASTMGRTEAAISYWRRAVRANPWSSQYHYQLAKHLAQHQDWSSAISEGEAARRLNPASEETRTLLITCYLRAGQKDRARAELGTLIALNPADEEVLRRWFAEQMP